MQVSMKQARVGAGFSQAAIAQKMGVHVNTYMKYEEAPEKMSLEKARIFADICGLNFDDILWSQNQPAVEK